MLQHWTVYVEGTCDAKSRSMRADFIRLMEQEGMVAGDILDPVPGETWRWQMGFISLETSSEAEAREAVHDALLELNADGRIKIMNVLSSSRFAPANV